MRTNFFIADTHFGDNDVFLMSGEAKFFNNCTHKDETIVENWNKVVQPGDRVFLLGDIGDPDWLVHLSGEIITIKGNHDIKADYEFPILYKNFFILSHEPQWIDEDGAYANIFGHVHNNPIYKTVSSRSYCVCACRNNYTPVSFEHIVKEIKKA